NEGEEAVALAGPVQLLFDFKQGNFRLFDHDEQLGMVGEDLPAQFAADASASAGDKHDPVPQHAGDPDRIEIDRGAAQQVLDRHRSRPFDLHLAGGQLGKGRHNLRGGADLAAIFDDFLHPFRRHAGQGDDELVHAGDPGQLDELFDRAVDGKTVDAAADFLRIVVDEENG